MSNALLPIRVPRRVCSAYRRGLSGGALLDPSTRRGKRGAGSSGSRCLQPGRGRRRRAGRLGASTSNRSSGAARVLAASSRGACDRKRPDARPEAHHGQAPGLPRPAGGIAPASRAESRRLLAAARDARTSSVASAAGRHGDTPPFVEKQHSACLRPSARRLRSSAQPSIRLYGAERCRESRNARPAEISLTCGLAVERMSGLGIFGRIRPSRRCRRREAIGAYAASTQSTDRLTRVSPPRL